MLLPDYWLTCPSLNFDEKTQLALDDLLHTSIGSGAKANNISDQHQTMESGENS